MILQTSQDHFRSLIDEFPVWNSEPNQPTMMRWATAPEHEKEIWYIDDCSSPFLRKMEGVDAVWVESNKGQKPFTRIRQKFWFSIFNIWILIVINHVSNSRYVVLLHRPPWCSHECLVRLTHHAVQLACRTVRPTHCMVQPTHCMVQPIQPPLQLSLHS